MLLQRLRKPVLVAALALLVLPGAALATDDVGSPNGAQSVMVIVHFPEPQPTVVLREECAFLEMNIPDYDCAFSLAQYAGQLEHNIPGDTCADTFTDWAGQAAPACVASTPQGVDYRFWEDNYWVFADGRATFPEDAEPPAPPRAHRPSDERGLGFF